MKMPLFRLSPLLMAGLLAAGSAMAQQSGKELSDAERAKRDAEKVFSFIKFHTVKPAAPAPAPAPKAAAAPVSAPAPRPAAVAAAPTASPAAAPAAAVSTRGAASAAGDSGATTAIAPASVAEPIGTSQPAPAVETAPAPAPAAAPVVDEPDEVPLKLVAYVPPDTGAQVMAAMDRPEVVVPVRFTVESDGRVSAARSMGSNVPRKVAQSAVRAVQQWRFDKLPEKREVDVEIAFKAPE